MPSYDFENKAILSDYHVVLDTCNARGHKYRTPSPAPVLFELWARNPFRDCRKFNFMSTISFCGTFLTILSDYEPSAMDATYKKGRGMLAFKRADVYPVHQRQLLKLWTL